MIDTSSVNVQATYKSEFHTNSSKCFTLCTVPDYYYEVLEINIIEDGTYTFGVNSRINAYPSLYNDKFDLFNLFANQIGRNTVHHRPIKKK